MYSLYHRDHHKDLRRNLDQLVTSLGYTATPDLVDYLVEVRKQFLDSPNYIQLISQYTQKYIQRRILGEQASEQQNAIYRNGTEHTNRNL